MGKAMRVRPAIGVRRCWSNQRAAPAALADDQLDRQCNLCLRRNFTIHQRQQHPSSLYPQALTGHGHRGQRRIDQLGDRDIVQTGESHLMWYPVAILFERT